MLVGFGVQSVLNHSVEGKGGAVLFWRPKAWPLPKDTTRVTEGGINRFVERNNEENTSLDIGTPCSTNTVPPWE